MGGVGKKFVFNYLTGVGQTLLLGFFFPPFYFFFPKRGEKELGKGSWPAVALSSAFSKSSLNIWEFSVHVLLQPSFGEF